jgi:hypothetical protein
MNNTITDNTSKDDLNNTRNTSKQSIDSVAETASGIAGISTGVATFAGLLGLASYCAYKFMTESPADPGDAFGPYFLPAIASAAFSKPLSLIAGSIAGQTTNTVVRAYDTVKTAMTKGLSTYTRVL